MPQQTTKDYEKVIGGIHCYSHSNISAMYPNYSSECVILPNGNYANPKWNKIRALKKLIKPTPNV